MLQQWMITVGILLSYIVALIIFASFPGSAASVGWRLVLGLGAVPAIIGLVMRTGPFGKLTAYLAVISGSLGIVSVVGPYFVRALGLAIVIGSAFTTVWVLLVGYRLYRLGHAGS